MVGFHMMDNQIIRPAAVKRLFQVPEPVLPFPTVDGIENGDPFIQDQVGIVGHPLRDDILAFKKIEIDVIDPDILDGR